MNNRHNLLIVLATTAFSPWMLVAQAKPPVLIGWLSFSSRESGARWRDALREGLAALGWKEGAQIMSDARWAEAH
jgi:hypothetical protein